MTATPFPGGRPAWDAAGTVLADDIAPFEERKLWLLNGGHSLLAYAGQLRGVAPVDEAVADPVRRGWLEAWRDTCSTRYDMSRRLEAEYFANLVVGGRLSASMARQIVVDLVEDQSQKVFIL